MSALWVVKSGKNIMAQFEGPSWGPTCEVELVFCIMIMYQFEKWSFHSLLILTIGKKLFDSFLSYFNSITKFISFLLCFIHVYHASPYYIIIISVIINNYSIYLKDIAWEWKYEKLCSVFKKHWLIECVSI